MADQLFNAEHLRWWHNRLHEAYGVAAGFGVAQVDDQMVSIAPGIAYDAFGREMWLLEPTTLALPPASGEAMALLASYRPPTGSRPALRWTPAESVRPHDGVRLARLTAAAVLITAVPQARAMKRPYIGHGATIAGNTPWEYWFPPPVSAPDDVILEDPQPGQVAAWGVQTLIDTSAAGFTRIPRYFAFLQGAPRGQHGFLLATRNFLADVTQTSFRLRLYPLPELKIVSEGKNRVTALLQAMRDGRVWVSWLGIEPLPDEGDVR